MQLPPLTLASLTLSIVAVTWAAWSSSPSSDPSSDPFYHAPSNLSVYRDGQMIRQRPVKTTIKGSFTSSQVLYQSPNTRLEADATVVTVWTPPLPAYPPKLLSYQTWAFVENSTSHSVPITQLETPIYLEWALQQGYFVVTADHAGSQAAFASGRQEGMAVLNGIRAALEFVTLPRKTRVVLYGYSGGGHATSWATNLAGIYAPDLNIVGSASGGTPIDPLLDFDHLNKSPLAGFIGANLVGLMNGYPRLNSYLLEHANDQGKALLARYRTKDFCIGEVASSAPNVDFLTLFTIPNFNEESIPSIVSRAESLLSSANKHGVHTPTFPRLLLHTKSDEIIPFEGVARYVDEQCCEGADIQFVKMNVSGHTSASLFGMPGTLLWIKSALEGSSRRVKCGTAAASFAFLTSPSAADVLGADVLGKLLSLNGTQVGAGSKVDYRQ